MASKFFCLKSFTKLTLTLLLLISVSRCSPFGIEVDPYPESVSDSDSDEWFPSNEASVSPIVKDSDSEESSKKAVAIEDLTDAQMSELFKEIDAHNFPVAARPSANPVVDRGLKSFPVDDLDSLWASASSSSDQGKKKDDWFESDDGEGDKGDAAFDKFLSDNADLLKLDEDYEADEYDDSTGWDFEQFKSQPALTAEPTLKTDDIIPEQNFNVVNDNDVGAGTGNGIVLIPIQGNEDDAIFNLLSGSEQDPKIQIFSIQTIVDSDDANNNADVDSLGVESKGDVDILDGSQVLDKILGDLQREFDSLQEEDQKLVPMGDDLAVNYGKFRPASFQGPFFRSDSKDLENNLDLGLDDSIEVRMNDIDWANVMYLDKVVCVMFLLLCYLMVAMAVRCCLSCRRHGSGLRNNPQLTIIRIDGQQLRQTLATQLNQDKVPLVHSSGTYAAVPCYYDEKPPSYNDAVTVPVNQN